MEFWIAVDGESYGPYEPGHVQAMVTGAQLSSEAEIWFPDRQQWVPAAYLVGFVPAPQLAPVGAVPAEAAGPAPAPAPAPEPATAYRTGPTGVVAPPATEAAQQWSQAASPVEPARPPAQPVAPAAAADHRRSNPFAIAALVLGVVALGVSWLPVFNLLSLGAAAAGLVLALLAFVWLRRGAGGKGLAIAAVALCVVAAAVSIVVNTFFVQAVDDAADDLAQAVQEQPADAALVTLGPPRWDGTTTTVRARVTNTTTQTINGGTFTVQAVARNGTLVDETTGALPAVAAGQATAVQVVFVKRIPPGATVSVTEVNASTS